MRCSNTVLAIAVVCMVEIPFSMQAPLTSNVNFSKRSPAGNSIEDDEISKAHLEAKVKIHANNRKEPLKQMKWQSRLDSYNSEERIGAALESQIYKAKKKMALGDAWYRVTNGKKYTTNPSFGP